MKRRKPRFPKQPPYVPVDVSGHPIDVSLYPAPKAPKQRPLTPDEVKRCEAPLNSRNNGFHLLQ